MRPYFQQGSISLYHGDCREVLTLIANEFCERRDVTIVADPPYGETSLDWDRWPDGWLAAVSDLTSAPSMWCFGSFRLFNEHGDDFKKRRWQFSQDLVWEKQNGTGFLTGRFRRIHELVTHWYRGPWSDVYVKPVFTHDARKRTIRRKKRPAHMNGIHDGYYTSVDGGPRQMTSVLQVRNCQGSAIHPCQKPLGVLWPLLEYSCPPGSLVIDPFTGSGSVLLAARDAGLSAIGIEISERQCERTANRLMERFSFTEASA